VWELIKAGGWLMLPIIACSVVALAIIVERFWTLQKRRVIPSRLVPGIWELAKDKKLDDRHVQEVAASSPLGKILAAGLINRQHGREVIKESIEETGRHVAHELERFLNTLGTIAAITPLLGLLGTVVGMIKVFTTITVAGVGDAGELAGGISEALMTTAAGLAVAIPSLLFYRYFRGRVDELVIGMEQESLALVEVLAGKRERGV
jgi:biopolymer transport protein ExbB